MLVAVTRGAHHQTRNIISVSFVPTLNQCTQRITRPLRPPEEPYLQPQLTRNSSKILLGVFALAPTSMSPLPSACA